MAVSSLSRLSWRIQAAVTNSDNTLFFHYQNEVAVAGATSNTISFTYDNLNRETLKETLALARYVGPYRPRFFVGLATLFVSAALGLAFPLMVKSLTQEASIGISQASVVENDDQFQERVAFLHTTLNQDVIAEQDRKSVV